MTKSKRILLDHGSGGSIAHNLIKELILPFFGNPFLDVLDDGAVLKIGESQIAFSTDSYVVDPIFFPGGSIGDLAINGTVNDISMCGAVPKFLSMSLILEEGFSLVNLERVLYDMKLAAEKACIQIVTGDTKVVPKGKVDKIFINTSGIGIIPENIKISGQLAKPGDSVILSGTMGDHGITIMTQRQGFEFVSNLKSDTAPLNHMVKKIIGKKVNIHALRDATRGGVGTSLNEIAQKAMVGIKIFERDLPIKGEVRSICDILGFDPLYLANEGKLIAFVPIENTEEVLSIMKNDERGKDACVVGRVVEDHPSKVFMKTLIGGERIIDMLTSEQLPRIC